MADLHRPNDDLVSSIRRLVADDRRGGSDGKLVLVPHLRIVRAVSRQEPAEALQPLQPLHLHPSARVDQTSLQAMARVAEPDDVDVVRVETAVPAVDTVVDKDVLTPEADLSEQALRDLVRALVREQFQGDLGQRITRSIRKLVKAEIAREMDLREKQ